jgi:thioredoxin-like negative regulator of GroEL
LLEIDEYEQARDAAQHAVQLMPSFPAAQLTLARCCLNCGAVKEALQGFNTARVRCGKRTALLMTFIKRIKMCMTRSISIYGCSSVTTHFTGPYL